MIGAATNSFGTALAGLPRLFDLRFHFPGLGEPAKLVFGEYEITVDADVEDTIAAADQLRLHPESFLQ